MKKLLILLPFILGCANEAQFHKGMVPVNLAVGYIAAVSVHEGGHALAAKINGAESIKLTIWPTMDDGGSFHLGLTEAIHRNWSSMDERFFNISGPMANLSTHIFTRELLKTGYLPREIQPTVQWISVCSAISLYGEAIFGMTRIKSFDLGKEPVWISLAMFSGALLHDIIDIFITDNPERYLKVLFGDDFYNPNSIKSTLDLISAPLRGGGLAGISLKF